MSATPSHLSSILLYQFIFIIIIFIFIVFFLISSSSLHLLFFSSSMLLHVTSCDLPLLITQTRQAHKKKGETKKRLSEKVESRRKRRTFNLAANFPTDNQRRRTSQGSTEGQDVSAREDCRAGRRPQLSELGADHGAAGVTENTKPRGTVRRPRRRDSEERERGVGSRRR